MPINQNLNIPQRFPRVLRPNYHKHKTHRSQSYVLLRTVLRLNRIRYLPTGGQRAICFLSFSLALCRVINSLLLWEKVAAVRLTDEESLLVGTPHPPLSRSPFPHWGRLFLYPESPSVFLTSADSIKDNKREADSLPYQ